MKNIFNKKLLLILFFAVLLRQIPLSQSFWLDEATSGLVVRNLNFSEIIFKFLPSDFHPPLYYLFLKFWSFLFGYSEISLRGFSLLAGVLTVYVVYLLSKELEIKNKYLASLLLASSALHIYYSSEARMYSLAALFVSIVFLMFLKLLKDGKNFLAWVFLSIFQFLSFGSHYLTILIIPTIVVYGIVKKLGINFWKQYLVSLTPSVLGLLLWLPILLKQLGGGIDVSKSSPLWANILGKTSIKEIALLFIKFLIGRISFENNLVYGFLVFLVFIPLIYVIYKGCVKIKNNITLYWFLTPIILGSLIGIFVPVFSYFRFLFVLPSFYLLITIGILEVKNHKPLIYIFLLINLMSSFYYLFNTKFYKEDWRSLVGFIESTRRYNSQVLFVANSQMEAYKYYNSDAKIDGPEALDPKSEEVWLVRYVKELFDPNDNLKTKVESLGFMEVGNYDFNGIPVLKYERQNANSN